MRQFGRSCAIFCCVGLTLSSQYVFAQNAGGDEATAQIVISAGTVVDFEIIDHVNSKLSKTGDTFRIRSTRPLLVGGREVAPAGLPGLGEVIHAARARAGGKAGELILTVRHLEFQNQMIALRSFRFGKGGATRTTEGLALAVVGGPLAYLVVGGEVDVPPSTAGNAKLAADFTVSVHPNGAAN